MDIPGLPANAVIEPDSVVEGRHDMAPVVDELPGESVPYALHAGEGLRLQVGPFQVTVMSRPQDNGGTFSLLRLACAEVSASRFVSLDSAVFVHVTEGHFTFWFADGRRDVIGGGSVTIPAGTVWSFAARGTINAALVHSSSDALLRLAEVTGHPTVSHTFRPAGDLAVFDDSTLTACGLALHDLPRLDDLVGSLDRLPEDVGAFAIAAGQGDRGEQFEQMNSFVCRPRHTGNQFFAMDTRGARAPYIPRHFHRLHTENFLCLGGIVKLHVNGQEVVLTPGDYVHAPAGTIHSFAFGANNTHMLGILTTGVFENFFDWMNRPSDHLVQLEDGSQPWFPGEAFGRVQAQLDVQVVGPPPVH